MLISETQATAIAWSAGGLLVLIGALIWYRMRAAGRPGAAIVLAVLALAGYLVAISRFANGTRVLIMRGDDAGYVRTDMRLYGSTTHTYANGRNESFSWQPARHIVINDTTRALRLVTVRYGAGFSSTQTLEPFQRIELNGLVRHFGPNDRPPEQTAAGYEVFWLSW